MSDKKYKKILGTVNNCYLPYIFHIGDEVVSRYYFTLKGCSQIFYVFNNPCFTEGDEVRFEVFIGSGTFTAKFNGDPIDFALGTKNFENITRTSQPSLKDFLERGDFLVKSNLVHYKMY